MAFLHRTRSLKNINVQLPETTETAQELKNVVDKVGEGFKSSFDELNISVSKAMKTRAWNVKANTNVKLAWKNIWFYVANIIAITLGFLSTLFLKSTILQISIWFMVLSVIVIFDVLHFFDRFLAFQSRVALGISLIFIGISIMTMLKSIIVLTIMVIVTTSLLIYVLNSKWLAAEQWLLTDVGQKALQLDLDNKATRAWQGFGRRETRSMLCSLGIESTDDALDIVHRPIWLAGYSQSEIRHLQYEKQTQQIELLRNTIAQLKQKIKTNDEEYNKSFEQIRNLKYELQDIKNLYEELNKEHNKLLLRYDEAIMANDELMEIFNKESDSIKKDSAVVEVTEKTDDVVVALETHESTDLEKLLNLIEEGYSQSKAASIIGISASKASRIIKSAKEKGEIPEGHPVFNIKPAVAAARI